MTTRKHLTDEQLNLELCKWLGWTEIDQRFPMLSGVGPDGNSGFLPDHINDISALGRIALIEAKLTDEQYANYGRMLCMTAQDDHGPGNVRAGRAVISATARQRVTAILLTVNPEVFR